MLNRTGRVTALMMAAALAPLLGACSEGAKTGNRADDATRTTRWAVPNANDATSQPAAAINDAAPAEGVSANEAAPVATPAKAATDTPPPPAPDYAQGGSYRALGTEPFWALAISDGRMTLDQPDAPARHYAVTRTEKGPSVRYQGDGITVTILREPCNDGMSDALYSDRVQIAMASGTLKGCGGQREEQATE